MLITKFVITKLYSLYLPAKENVPVISRHKGVRAITGCLSFLDMKMQTGQELH